MRQFSAVKRFERKLQLMAYMSSFDQTVTSLRPQIAIVTSASRNLRSNTKIKKILEIILAFGNYMNSAKKGPCYGFKLSSLDSLTITKSGTDKQRNLLNYIVDMINNKYPELKNFHTELNYIKVSTTWAANQPLRIKIPPIPLLCLETLLYLYKMYIYNRTLNNTQWKIS